MMVRDAVISDCGLYRYELRRTWDETKPPLVMGMLNPSTADSLVDDPTITRCIKRARVNGCGSLIVWNLGAGRATDPKVWKAMDDPIGPKNNLYIRAVLSECQKRYGLAVVGWGAHGSFMNRDAEALEIARQCDVKFFCLGTTKQGQPRHPLYIRDSQPLISYPSAGLGEIA